MMAKIKNLLTGGLALVVVLVAGQALAAVAWSNSFAGALGEASTLGQGRFDGLAESLDLAGPLHSTSTGPVQDPLPLFRVHRPSQDAGWGGEPASLSLSNASGPGGALLPNRAAYLPDPLLSTSLPSEPTLVLPTGPPFELIRPA